METAKTTAPASDNDAYDPHDHRQVEKPTTNVETLIHILKGALGTGVLAMPLAFKNAGYLNGLISTALIGVLCIYCTNILIVSQYILCKRHRVPWIAYPDSMKLALEAGPPCLRWLANPSVWIVDSFLALCHTGICCVYIVFVASNLKQICDTYATELDVKVHILILILPFMALFMIRSLKLLVPFSQFGNLVTFTALGMICYYLFQDMPSLSERKLFVNIETYPLFFGTVLFALEAVGVMIALESNMETPKSYTGIFGVLSIGLSIVVVLYAIIGFFGYWKYGDDIEGSITLSLPDEHIYAVIIKVLFSVAIYISYALQGYVPVNIIWNNFIRKRNSDIRNPIAKEYLIRLGVVIFTFTLAGLVPRLALFISLFGAFAISMLGLIFPVLMEICVLYPDNYGKFNYILYKDILILIASLFGWFSGTYTSIQDIVLSFID